MGCRPSRCAGRERAGGQSGPESRLEAANSDASALVYLSAPRNGAAVPLREQDAFQQQDALLDDVHDAVLRIGGSQTPQRPRKALSHALFSPLPAGGVSSNINEELGTHLGLLGDLEDGMDGANTLVGSITSKARNAVDLAGAPSSGARGGRRGLTLTTSTPCPLVRRPAVHLSHLLPFRHAGLSHRLCAAIQAVGSPPRAAGATLQAGGGGRAGLRRCLSLCRVGSRGQCSQLIVQLGKG